MDNYITILYLIYTWMFAGVFYGVMYWEGLISVWDTDEGSSFVQVPGKNIVVLWRGLVGGVTEPKEWAGKLGTAGEDLGEEGSR